VAVSDFGGGIAARIDVELMCKPVEFPETFGKLTAIKLQIAAAW